MPEDRSLDEFGRSDADGETGDGETGDGDGETGDDDATTAESADPNDASTVDDPTPATSTSTWTADGAGCERCGARAERRWLDDGDRVCSDCKSW